MKLAVVTDNPQASQRQKLARFPDDMRPDAVVLTERCADPLYRRAIRTSMGAVFTVPWTRVDGPEALHEAGFELVALTPAATASKLRAAPPLGPLRRASLPPPLARPRPGARAPLGR